MINKENQKKPSKLFSIVKTPYKTVYRFANVKWVKHKRFAEVLDMIKQCKSDISELSRQNKKELVAEVLDMIKQCKSDISELSRQNKKELDILKKEVSESKNAIKNKEVNQVQRISRFEQYQPKFAKSGYLLEKIDDKIRISNKTIIIEGESENTLWTAEAVLCKDEYHFDMNQKYVMFDIGLNLGITSLHKATDKNCVKIYGYEPFTPTFKLAQNNMSLNPTLSQKISIFNYGLSDKDKELEINYNSDRPGAMSSIKNVFPECDSVEKIKVKEAAQVLAPLFEKHKEKIFLKIDCEGAEKEILPNLDKLGLLKKTDVIIMEWHFETPEWIEDILKKNGFIIFRNNDVPGSLGMIRAYRAN